MREGTINCNCGHSFWIATVSNSTTCPSCNEPINVEHIPHIPEVTEPVMTEKEKAIEDLKEMMETAIAKIMNEGD